MGRKRERTRIVSRMDELPDDIRVQVESMLLDKTVSYKEIAARLGISHRTVEWHVAEAILGIGQDQDR